MPPLDWEKITTELLDSAFDILKVDTKKGEKVSYAAIFILQVQSCLYTSISDIAHELLKTVSLGARTLPIVFIL